MKTRKHLKIVNADMADGQQLQRRLAQFLQTQRLEANLPIEVLADYLGLSVQKVIAYEEGSTPIPLNRIYAMANCLNISPNSILKLIVDEGGSKK